MTSTGRTGGLTVRVVGSSPAIPRAGRACSAYVFETGSVRFAVDFGSGAFAALRTSSVPEELDAVVVTHMHADHFLDVVPLRYALTYGPHRRSARMPLHLPPGGKEMLTALTDAFAHEPHGNFLTEVYDLRTYDPAEPLVLGPARLTFAAAAHYIPTYAVRVACDDGVVTFSSDTAPCRAVIDLARGSDLFICEATLLATETTTGTRGHCSAADAGSMAASAGVKRLVLSHWPAETTPERLIREAAAHYDGPIAVADDGLRLTVSRAR